MSQEMTCCNLKRINKTLEYIRQLFKTSDSMTKHLFKLATFSDFFISGEDSSFLVHSYTP